MGDIRFVAITDTHGDKVDLEALSVACDFAADFAPDWRIHLGDAWDFRWLRDGAGNGEKAEDCELDIEMGFECLEAFRPNVLMMGNHDWRLDKAVYGWRGERRMFANMLRKQIDERCEAIGCEVRPYGVNHEPFRIGPMSFLHGYAHGNNASAKHADIYGDCLFGHIHTHTSHTNENGHTATSLPCMCDLSPIYANASLRSRRWQVGFAYGTIYRNGTYTVSIAKRDKDGHWNIPEVGNATRRHTARA